MTSRAMAVDVFQSYSATATVHKYGMLQTAILRSVDATADGHVLTGGQQISLPQLFILLSLRDG